MLRPAGPGEGGAAQVEVAGRSVVIRGTAPRVAGGVVQGEFDLSEPGAVRLTLYDSLPGRPVDQPAPSEARAGRVEYEARIGPLAPGEYDVVVGRYDARRRLVVVKDAPARVRIGRN